MAWQTPKTNWNALDYYNFGDLNRVEINTLELANSIKSNIKADYNIPSVVLNRDYSTIEFAEGLNRIESNIDKLKVFTIPSWTPSKLNWKAGDSFSFIDANRLESNLLVLYTAIQSIINNFKYCGTYSCGEEGDIY